MGQLETVTRDNWEAFTGAPAAVLMLGKSDCKACQAWAEELEAFLDSEEAAAFSGVRFGKLLLDTPGLTGFKRAYKELLAEVDSLPFTLLLQGGEVKKTFVGGGIERLSRRMERLFQSA